MATEKILVVDDEKDILELVRYNLDKEGFQVTCVTTGEEALHAVSQDAPDLIVLDLMLPGVDGLDVCKRLKRDPNTAEIPIIMLTAKGEESDVVVGLELGADDYVTKPFSPRVLCARVRAVLRRGAFAPQGDDDVIRIEGLTLHPGRHEVTLDNQPIHLTLTEFKLFHLLARRRGWVFTRQQIVNSVRGDDCAVTERSVDVHVVGLRKKLGDFGAFIETVRGVGYRFKD